MMTAGQIIAAAMNKSLRYDTLTAFDPISLIGSASLIIATHAKFPAGNVKELVASARADPGKYIFASAGYGATQHMSAELFMQTAGIQMRHVPFRSSPEAISSILGGQVHVVFDTVSALLPQVRSGELKALAVTGKDRFPAVPDLPTAVESGVLPGYDVTTWYGLFGPSGMPPDVVARLNATINGLLGEPAVRQRLETAGLVVQGSTPAAFGTFMAAELTRWNAVRVAAGLSQN
jgi:tripartite-type tricarboxylate transporter receptor subunit TctC